MAHRLVDDGLGAWQVAIRRIYLVFQAVLSIYRYCREDIYKDNGKRVIDGRPVTLWNQIDQSLSRLKTDSVDLYYLHRWEKSVPIEESVGELARMVEAGKARPSS